MEELTCPLISGILGPPGHWPQRSGLLNVDKSCLGEERFDAKNAIERCPEIDTGLQHVF